MIVTLLLLYYIGYIHRDLSPGSVDWDQQAEHGRISDFEFARSYNQLRLESGNTRTVSDYLSGFP
jgi:hypothetical protein